ncbi:hypothetical protein DXX93_08565 [Thalassotalea euphylliae]|uniref:Uncharacterized protein n=1 Tax=Thalassotalea euphylliae TaxID=1655234 RepID=A0A3E0TQA0_9GAMM|nr:hypothetical protein [Thalassotalea euphylliae]REL26623.1 hypothetical protein DXX93_08565 [Thalassotalea euphylliae]
MAIKTGEYLNSTDIYIDYEYEDVMFRRMSADGSIHRKFYGETECKELLSFDNKLFNDALLYGELITEEQYAKGKAVEKS